MSRNVLFTNRPNNFTLVLALSLLAGSTAQAQEGVGGRAIPRGAGDPGFSACETRDAGGSPVSGLSSGNPWPSGVVYYNFDAAVTSANRTRMLNAMAIISATVNVTFVVRTTQAGYITIRNSSVANVNSSSSIGRTGARQFIDIWNWTSQGIVIHEMFHALGLRHEQARADRDEYVSINNPKINPTYSHNLDIQGGTVSGPYDFLSLMHYSPFDFSLDGDRVIDVKGPYALYWQYSIGRQTQISAGDAAALRAIYGGTTRPDYFQPQSPAHGAFVGTTTPTLNWTASNGADDYQVRIGTDQFSVRIIHTADVSGTSYSIPPGVLAPNQEYFWRVKARNAKGTTGTMPLPSSVLSTRSAPPAVVYVDASAPSDGDGSSWNSAFASVHSAENVAFARAMSDPDGPGVEVRMAGGTYRADDGTNNRFIFLPLDSGLTLRGGYAGRNAPNPDARDPSIYETVITGDILGNDTADPATRSDNTYWLAIASVSNHSPVLDGLTFRGAANDNDIGGAVVSDSSGLIVTGCRFESNRAAYYGCGLSALFGGSFAATDCVFENNYAFGAPANSPVGATAALFRASATFDRTRFLDNTGTSGSAISAYDANVRVFNSLLTGNSATGVTNGVVIEGGTIAARHFDAGTTQMRIVNTTIADNAAPAGSQGALFTANGSGSERSMLNSILWGNGPGTIAGDWTADHSLIQGGWAGAGILTGDPMFTDAPGGDYTVLAGSIAVDAGSAANLSPGFLFDLTGAARVAGAAPDLGAFERSACPGDLNSDGLVDDSDFVLFAGAYDILDCSAPAMPGGCPADLNSDAMVDDSDFVLFAGAYNALVCP